MGLVKTPNLPKEIYFIKGGRRDRPYAQRGHVKLALNGRYSHERQRIRIYQAFGNVNGEIVWHDVTREFVTETGEFAW
ncbi:MULTISPECIES: hypothetical protein [Streptosporangium]|uniref:Uncharacterized protein n=1 Tax=Streptosporangium brasiliense TaxID=47480 RepID=A0ABT9RM92_9ACTN|nr:hypothetical protein [Streptosporangium brasiliense]MDP9870416.1 hypothetical protein [Streptosporangium brasiliense]